MRVRAAEVDFHLLLADMHRRGDDMTRHLPAQLDDIFAEIGFNGHHPGRFEMRVEANLLGNHGFALGDRLGASLAANAADDPARFVSVARPMHVAAALQDAGLVFLKVEIKMRERMVLDLTGAVAQRLELRQLFDNLLAPVDEAGAHFEQGFLQFAIGERGARIVLELRRCGMRGHELVFLRYPLTGNKQLL